GGYQPGRDIAEGKISWFATMRAVKQSTRIYHQPAAATTLSARGYACIGARHVFMFHGIASYFRMRYQKTYLAPF
ncbi:MAG: hypothetical protein LBK13_06445, partial [Spirochaetales bacterium]|nr:hypothetical protein [Spirochaetales bacterium]